MKNYRIKPIIMGNNEERSLEYTFVLQVERQVFNIRWWSDVTDSYGNAIIRDKEELTRIIDHLLS